LFFSWVSLLVHLSLSLTYALPLDPRTTAGVLFFHLPLDALYIAIIVPISMNSVVIGQRNDRMNARKKFIPPIKNVRLKLITNIMKYTTNPKTVKKFIAILLFFILIGEIQ